VTDSVSENSSNTRQSVAVFVGLAGLVFLVFAGCLENQFLNWDDNLHILSNPVVENFDWVGAFTTSRNSVYHPLADLSWAIEYWLVGLDPLLYHLDNVLLHGLNAFLVFILVRRLAPESGFVPLFCAALFAVHPMQVESVAWATERKGLLCTGFSLLTMVSYFGAGQTKRTWVSELSTFVFFALAILAKPTAIMLPVVLLSMEYLLMSGSVGRRQRLRLAPFFALSIARGVATLAIQAPPLDTTHLPLYNMSFFERIGVACQSLVFYLAKFLFPEKLSVYYDIHFVRAEPHQWILAVVAALAAGWWFRANPHARRLSIWSLLFFLVTIAQMTKIIPFSSNSIFNDRYLYFPILGLILFTACSLETLAARGVAARRAVYLACIAVLAFASVQSHARVKAWQNSETLWSSAIEVYPKTSFAYYKLALYTHETLGRPERAIRLLESAVREEPGFAEAYLRAGIIHAEMARVKQAERKFAAFLEAAPSDAYGRGIVANFFLVNGKVDRAIEIYREALRLNPDFVKLYTNFGVALMRHGDDSAAGKWFEKFIEADPKSPVGYMNLVDLYSRQGQGKRVAEVRRRAAEVGVDLDAIFRQRSHPRNDDSS